MPHTILAAVLLAVAACVSAASNPDAETDAWADRLVELEARDANWREVFALGQRIAELEPPEAALEVMRAAWPRLENVRTKQQLVKAWQFDLPTPFRTRFHPETYAFFEMVLDAGEGEVSSWVLAYLATYTRTEMDAAEARAWLADHRDEHPMDTLESAWTGWAERWRDGDADDRVELQQDLRRGYPARRNPRVAAIAEATGVAGITEAIVHDPAMPRDDRLYAVDRLKNLRPDARTPDAWAALEQELEAIEVVRAPVPGLRTVGGDERKRWLLHPPLDDNPPEPGYALLLVLPGGDGSSDFAPFVAGAIRAQAGTDVAVAQLIAPGLGDNPDRAIVWPTERLPDGRVDFTIEPVAEAVLNAVRDELPIDPERIFVLGWSSGGPPAYTLTLREGSPIRGAIVVMSVFRPQVSPPLEGAAGKSFYILHSPDDFIQMRFPTSARDELTAHGGRVWLETYEGGHGWQGDSVARIAEAVRWLSAVAGDP
jgi:predicted esterase